MPATATPNVAEQQLSQHRVWLDDGSHNTHAAQQQRLQHHIWHDNSAHSTTCGMTTAPAA